jgi:hypothetical protein
MSRDRGTATVFWEAGDDGVVAAVSVTHLLIPASILRCEDSDGFFEDAIFGG